MKPGDAFYYADEFNISWLPTLRAMWSPKGQQVMISTPGQPKVHYGLGAVNYQDGEVEAVVRSATGRLVLLYLPTYSPWLNPIEMLWRHFRREVTHCELFESVKVLIEASENFFHRFNQSPDKVLSIIGAHLS